LGKTAFPELPNGIDERRLANPTPCGIRKNEDQLFRSHNAESRMEYPAFAKQSSLVDETGIEPATSSLRTRKNLNSKGCGGVMRVAPVGLVSKGFQPEQTFQLAAEAAACTHGHPSGYLSAGAMAGMVRFLAPKVG